MLPSGRESEPVYDDDMAPLARSDAMAAMMGIHPVEFGVIDIECMNEGGNSLDRQLHSGNLGPEKTRGEYIDPARAEKNLKNRNHLDSPSPTPSLTRH